MTKFGVVIQVVYIEACFYGSCTPHPKRRGPSVPEIIWNPLRFDLERQILVR